MEDCKRCPFGTTSQPGTASVQHCEAAPQPCPVGQIAPAGAVSAEQCACKPGFGGESCCLKLCVIMHNVRSPGGALVPQLWLERLCLASQHVTQGYRLRVHLVTSCMRHLALVRVHLAVSTTLGTLATGIVVGDAHPLQVATLPQMHARCVKLERGQVEGQMTVASLADKHTRAARAPSRGTHVWKNLPALLAACMRMATDKVQSRPQIACASPVTESAQGDSVACAAAARTLLEAPRMPAYRVARGGRVTRVP